MMKLITGLGNPGRVYAHNRHNIGYRCIDRIAKLHSIPVNKNQCQARTGSGKIDGAEVVLAKPKTFMNLSGKAVSLLLYKYRISVDELIIIYDDMDLPLGKLRIRQGGGSGGHKGINSIMTYLESQNFYRVRLGIGHPNHEKNSEADNDVVIGYVLSDFSREENKLVKMVLNRAAEAIQCILTEGIDAAMNKYNG